MPTSNTRGSKIAEFVLTATVLSAAAVSLAAPAAADGKLMTGDYEVLNKQGTVLDTWTVVPECTRLTVGCYASISSAVLGELVAAHTTDNEWSSQVVGLLPICADNSNGQGKLIFEWDGDTGTGLVTKIEQSGCRPSQPGTVKVPIVFRPK
ncbi:hypothetical protein [Mycolicibacterium fortuitum]